MEPVLSVAGMQRVDANAVRGIDALMDAAGYAVALSAVAMGVGYGSVVHVLAGPGNNGGDGYVAAKYLRSRGAAVTVHHNGTPASGSAPLRAMQAASASGVRVQPIGAVQEGDLVIDALYGTGFRGELPKSVEPWLDRSVAVLAVDIPSGISGDTGNATGRTFTAQRTATFHALKTGHLLGEGPDRCGHIDLYDIGLVGGEASMWRFTASDVVVPNRHRTAHKWSAGAVATIGGLPGLTGAAVLCARAALRAGAGASTIFTTAGTAAIYEAVAPDIVTAEADDADSWGDDASEVLSLLGKFPVLVVGPGLEPANAAFVEQLTSEFPGTIILDAGALNALEQPGVLQGRLGDTILTPHAGEFRRLTGSDPSPDTIRELAQQSGSVVVAKGNPTVVADDRLIVIDTGGPELATIGTGDVLAGMIAAFASSGIPVTDAAASAAYLHGLAGHTLGGREIVTARALVDQIGTTVAWYTARAEQARRA
jgi:hydroxyethylthiazole kinase-like uncharacterized protein yjeF